MKLKSSEREFLDMSAQDLTDLQYTKSKSLPYLHVREYKVCHDFKRTWVQKVKTFFLWYNGYAHFFLERDITFRKMSWLLSTHKGSDSITVRPPYNLILTVHFKLIIHSKRLTEHASTLNALIDNTRILKTKYCGIKIVSGNKAIPFPSSLMKTVKFLKEV